MEKISIETVNAENRVWCEPVLQDDVYIRSRAFALNGKQVGAKGCPPYKGL